MAKRKTSSKSKSKSRKRAVSAPKSDAATLALFRWYTVTIEQVLLEAYATSPQSTGEFVKIMRGTITGLYEAGRRSRMVGDDECDPGYERCKDGLCAPMCSFSG